MRITTRNFLMILIGIVCCIGITNAQADYEEIGGVVVMEAESFDLDGTGWVKESLIAGATGDEKAYIRYTGSTSNSDPDKDRIETTIKINTTGKYLFKWRSLQRGAGSDDANDSWLEFPDASDFYAQRATSKVYPKDYEGEEKNPTAVIPGDKNPGSKGAFKIWSCCQQNVWLWYAKTWDYNSHFIFVEFDAPGVYKMQISGRSFGNNIDRITLSNDPNEVNNPASESGDVDTKEDDFVLGTSTFDLSQSGISVYPNPVQGVLHIKGLQNAMESIEVIDALGRVIPTTMQRQNAELIQLDTTRFAPGLYFVRIGDLGQRAFMVTK